jgi:hypothetical protein
MGGRQLSFLPENADEDGDQLDLIEEAALCQWFALCARPATTVRPHPLLGDVQICTECDDKMKRLGGVR